MLGDLAGSRPVVHFLQLYVCYVFRWRVYDVVCNYVL